MKPKFLIVKTLKGYRLKVKMRFLCFMWYRYHRENNVIWTVPNKSDVRQKMGNYKWKN